MYKAMKRLFVFSIIAICFNQTQIAAADQSVYAALMKYYQYFQDENLAAYYAVQDLSRVTPKELKLRKEITQRLWQRFDTLSFEIRDLSVAREGYFAIAKYTLHSSIKGPDATGAIKTVDQKRPYAAILVSGQNQWKVSAVTDPDTLSNVAQSAFRRRVSAGADLAGIRPDASSGGKIPSSSNTSPQRQISKETQSVNRETSQIRSRREPEQSRRSPSSLAAWIDWIESGKEFFVILEAKEVDDSGWTGNWQSDPLGTIKAGETYTLRYANDKFTATGFHEKSRAKETHSTAGIQPRDSHFAIWGRTFTFDGQGKVWDRDYGIVGSLSTVVSSIEPPGRPVSGKTPQKPAVKTSEKALEPAPKLINIALNRPTLVSSFRKTTRSEAAAKDGDGAVDGDRNQGMFGFHSLYEQSPWWQVDLGEGAVVHKLEIYNRIAEAKRAKSLQVLVSDDGSNWQQVYDNGGKYFRILRLPLNPIAARYLRLQLTAKTYFHLSEVEVWGTK